MDGLFDYFDKLKKYAAYPVIFVSAALTVVYLIAVFNFAETDSSAAGVKAFAAVMFGVSFCALMIYHACRSIKKALASAVCIMCADTVLYYTAGAHFSFIYCVLLTALILLVMENCNMIYGLLISLAAAVLTSVVFALVYENYNELLRLFAQSIRGRGALFGALSNPVNLLLGSGLDELFYTKAYSATVADGSKIITGAADIFSAFDAPQSSTARFLCGRYFAAVFIPVGIFAALYKRLDSELLFAFLFSLVPSVIFGDERLFYLLVLFVSPLIYAGAVIIIFIGYAVAGFVDIRTGFTDGAGIIELIRNIQKPVYFLLTALILTLLAYFFSRLVAVKFNVLTVNRLPKSVRMIVNSLGGEENILTVQNGAVIVANPNLIDVLTLDCDVHENKVSLSRDDFELLQNLTQ